MNFTLNCSTANVVVYFHGLSEAPDLVRKYGFTPASTPLSTPTSPGTRVWYEMPGAIIETVTFDNKAVYKASYTLTDGGLGDDDLTVNGTIIDPVGAAQQALPGAGGAGSARSIPGLFEWAQYLLMLLIAIAGTRLHWQKKRQSRS